MSGFAKGIKKAFKAIGNVVKKVFKSPIFKALLIGAAAIFTGGAALGAFGALTATGGATFGSVMSGALAGGMAPFQAALGALGMGGGAGGAGALVGPPAELAGGLAEGAGAAGGAAEGAAALVGPPVDLAGGIAESSAGSLVGPPADLAGGGSGWNLMGPPSDLAGGAGQVGATPGAIQTVGNATPGGVDTATSTAWQNGAGLGKDTLTSAGVKIPWENSSVMDYVKAGWKLLKPETPDGYRMWGQLLLGAGSGILQGRNAQDQRDWQERMSRVPDITGSFQQKPDFRWALMAPQPR